MTKEDAKDVIIIGGGLTGLTIAFYLKKAGKKISVLEKENHTGGVIHTYIENGFVFEAGPNTGVLSTPELVELFDDLKDKCTLETANPKSKKRYILKNGQWHALPSGLISAMRTPLFSIKDKLRILGEPFRKAGTNPDESVADLVRRRLGKSFLEYAVDPFISGIYAGDAERLITRFALPKLYALEQNYGSFIKGAVQKRKEPKTELEKKATREVFSVKNGLQNLVNSLSDEIGAGHIFPGCRNIEVKPNEKGFSISFTNEQNAKLTLSAKMVITATGTSGLPSLLPFISKNQMQSLTDLNHAKIVQVAVGYHHWNGMELDAFGGLIPGKENRNVLGILFPSSIFSNRAPEDGALLSVFLGGMKNPGLFDMDDQQITSIVLKEIRSALKQNGAPDLLKIFRYPKAIPQYEASTRERLQMIQQIQSTFPGLIIAGNIRDGIGMADRVRQAKQIVNQIIKERPEKPEG